MTIFEYLEAIKARLLSDPVILNFHLMRERATLIDAHMRARLTLVDDSWLEFSEYVQRTASGQIEVITYSYHWADSDGNLIRRWDNTPHFPSLPNFPHHIHYGTRARLNPANPLIFSPYWIRSSSI